MIEDKSDYDLSDPDVLLALGPFDWRPGDDDRWATIWPAKWHDDPLRTLFLGGSAEIETLCGILNRLHESAT